MHPAFKPLPAGKPSRISSAAQQGFNPGAQSRPRGLSLSAAWAVVHAANRDAVTRPMACAWL